MVGGGVSSKRSGSSRSSRSSDCRLVKMHGSSIFGSSSIFNTNSMQVIFKFPSIEDLLAALVKNLTAEGSALAVESSEVQPTSHQVEGSTVEGSAPEAWSLEDSATLVLVLAAEVQVSAVVGVVAQRLVTHGSALAEAQVSMSVASVVQGWAIPGSASITGSWGQVSQAQAEVEG